MKCRYDNVLRNRDTLLHHSIHQALRFFPLKDYRYFGNSTANTEKNPYNIKFEENIALNNDATKIRLWVEKDKWMRSWYERLGFKYDGENDELGKITMTKYLEPKA